MPPTNDVIGLWYHYEEIAMHFNGLIAQFRLQLIGGAGALGTVAAYLIGTKVVDAKERRCVRTLASFVLLALILAAAILDLFYYNRLLYGAVAALLELERNHPEINMSTKIEDYVGAGKYVVWIAYGLMILPLLTFFLWSLVDYLQHRADEPEKPQPAKELPAAVPS